MEDRHTRHGRSAKVGITLALLGLLVALSTVSRAAFRPTIRSSDRPVFSLSATQRALLYPGQATTFTVKAGWMSQDGEPVTLRVIGLPSGVTGTFVSRNAQLNSVTPLRPRATLIVGGSSTVTPGRYAITIVGSSGGLTERTAATLRIRRLPRSYVLVSVSPRAAATTTSAIATYTVSIERTGFPEAVDLCVRSILPLGVTATFEPSRTSGFRSTLTLTTNETAREGTYPFAIGARGPARDGSAPTSCRPPRVGRALDERRAGRFTTGATATMVVGGSGDGGGGSPTPTETFTITGEAARALFPGDAPSPIELVFTNPTSATISVTSVTVTVSGTSAGAACSAANFATTSFAYGALGTGGVPVGPGQTVSLTDAAVAQASWPTVRMVGSGNQDACRGATVHLSFSDGQAYTP